MCVSLMERLAVRDSTIRRGVHPEVLSELFQGCEGQAAVETPACLEKQMLGKGLKI
jgi:hypothetical protein